MLGGLARLDYIDVRQQHPLMWTIYCSTLLSLSPQGPVSAYFTVFAASYLPVHVTIVDKADSVWTKNLGQPLLKVMPC